MPDSKPRVIIIGGGFGGVKCAETLCAKLKKDAVDLVLFNNENHLVFSPLLAEVVGSSIGPMDVIVPLRQLLPRLYCRTEEVETVDLKTNEVQFEDDRGECARMKFDHLVLACGNVTNLNVVPGMADHAFPLKTVADASTLRSHIMEQMEKAEVSNTEEFRKWHLTFIVVGGGFSGAESAGEINDLVRSSARYFKNWKEKDVAIKLIHSRDQLLPEISPKLRDFARRKMEKSGVTIMLNQRVSLVTKQGVGLEGGEFISGGTVVCTIGNSTAPLVQRLGFPIEKGRLATEMDLRLKGRENVWVVGDCGHIVNSRDNQLAPTTGQFAEREGKQCALNIVRTLRGEPTKPFYFKQLGELCSIGGHSAVADLMGMHLSGFIAWFIWRGVYLFKLPSWGRRFQVGFDWAWLLLYPRDLAHVRNRPTDRVGQAHYQPGDLIIRKGEPATNFFVIKKGEVEVIRPGDAKAAGNGQADGETIAVLGAGSFFGEKALMSNEPRVFAVRARTPVDVLVMGKNVFTQISGTLGPLREALAQALNRRRQDAWKGQAEVLELLKSTKISKLLEPIPKPLLKPTTTLMEVSRAFVDEGHEFFYVSEDGQNLDGVVTITDILRGRGTGAMLETPVSEFMTKNPVTVAMDDDCAIASAALREYRLKSLPVVEHKESRKLAGSIRIRRLMAYVFAAIDGKSALIENNKQAN